MALMLLPVLLLGVIAAAADDVPVTWLSGQHSTLQCDVPLPERLQLRRPPPPLEGEERPRAIKPYIWRKDDQELPAKRVGNSGALEFVKRRDGEGVYKCLVRHHGGLVMGYPIRVKFSSIERQPSILPENVTTRQGQPVVVTCRITSSPNATVSWLRDDRPLDDNRYYTLQNQLLITDARTADSGSYRCTATNVPHNKTKTSHAGTLAVENTTSDQDVDFLPLSYEGNIFASLGSRIVLPCPVVGWPRPRIYWEVSNPNARSTVQDFNNQVLVVESLQRDTQGVYTCFVEDTDLSRTFNVTLTEPAVITIPPISKEALRASTVRFNCTAKGHPAPTISWYKDGQPLTFGAGRINLRKSADGQRTELVISGVTSDDAGVYQCFAQNAASVDSSWATLNVTGANAAGPTDIQCWPLADRKVKVTWKEPEAGKVVAYTVHGTPLEDKAGSSLLGTPVTETEETVTLAAPLVPYEFQVRAYSKLTSYSRNAASDFSEGAVCQGQGVPLRLSKINDKEVLVSWKSFSEEYPGVVQWILQYKADNNSVETNVTLAANEVNFTLAATPSKSVLLRLLGSRRLPWLHQDLTLVSWTNSSAAYSTNEAGESIPIPQELEVLGLSARELTVGWRCDGTKYYFLVCLRNGGGKTCQETKQTLMTFEDLQPGTKYEILIQARTADEKGIGGAFSAPLIVTTPFDSPQRFKELSGRFINSSTLEVSWNGSPGRYKVHYSSQLTVPVEQWHSVDIAHDNSVLITGIDPTDRTYLMVTAYDPEENSKVETIPPLYKDLEATDLQYEYTTAGVRVWWRGSGSKVVIYAQNITVPLEQWYHVLANQSTIELTNLNPALPLYVTVKSNKNMRGQVLTIQPRPIDNSSLFIGVGTAVGIIILALMALAVICFWRKRKRLRSPAIRSRRRNIAANDNIEEEAEMKAARGAGGGGERAGAGAAAPPNGLAEPLLNGHVHITENPQLKTPNGKMRKGVRYLTTLDVSRYEDPDSTLETVLDGDTTASTTINLLDTSRRPEYDLSRSSRDMSTNNSFAKLPDDNMNSELTRSSFQLDNSKILPTLQPNG